VLVASSAPLDQFMVQNPEYFFGRSPEHGYVNPDNLFILLNHLKCAAFELPLREDEKFGALDLRRLCQHLEETGFLHHTKDGWHWLSESYPADALSLRSVSSDNFVIVDNTHEPRVIGETDFSSALTTLHEKAIYIQDGVQYHVERLDYDDRKAYVHQVDSEYFTDAISYTKIKILETFDSATAGAARKNHGEVQVNTQVVGFKKIKFYTMENVGSGELTLPEQEMHTTAFWLTLPRPMMEALPYNSTERLDGVNGLASALGAIATLLVMCDARDLGTSVGENAELEVSEEPDPEGGQPGKRTVVRKIFEPNIYLYDSYPGGVGLSEPLFRMSGSLLEKTHKLISECPCPTGCPSCVGPIGEIGEKGKEVALEILRRMVATN
jgi:DEAD/DEAH box helicase domain-containing protein